MQDRKFCAYLDTSTDNCTYEESNIHCRALNGKSCPNYKKYNGKTDLIKRIVRLENRVHKLEEILAFEKFEVDL